MGREMRRLTLWSCTTRETPTPKEVLADTPLRRYLEPQSTKSPRHLEIFSRRLLITLLSLKTANSTSATHSGREYGTLVG